MAENQSTDHPYSSGGNNGLYNQDGRDQPSQNRPKNNSDTTNLEESSVEVNELSYTGRPRF